MDSRVRLIALAKFCAKKAEVSFEEIAKGLAISIDGVETAIIDGWSIGDGSIFKSIACSSKRNWSS